MQHPIRRWMEKWDHIWVWPLALLPLLPEYIAPILAVAAFAFACVDADRHREPLRIGRVGGILLAYIAYMAIGTLYSAHPFNTMASVGMWAVMFLVYLSVVNLVRSPKRMQQLFCGVSIAAGVAGLIAVVQYVGLTVLGWDISPFFWDPVDAVFFRFFPMELDFFVPGDIRTGSTFTNQNIFAEYMVMALPFTCQFAFSGKRTPLKVAARLCLIAAIGGVAVSLCRGAYLAVLVMALMAVVFLRAARLPLLVAGVTGLACIPQSVAQRFLSIGSGDKSIMNRLAQWQVALQNASQRPLFGYGAGVSNTTDMLHAVGIDAPHVHNLPLMLLIEGGLPSLILIGAVLFTVLRYCMDLHILRRKRTLSVALLAFTAGLCTCSMFDFPFMTPKLVGFFLLVMAIADATAHLHLGRAWVPSVKDWPIFSRQKPLFPTR